MNMSVEIQNVDDVTKFVHRIVTCPCCKGDSVYNLSNQARPFCSPSCRAMDLGAWANEDFRFASSDSTLNEDFKDA